MLLLLLSLLLLLFLLFLSYPRYHIIIDAVSSTIIYSVIIVINFLLFIHILISSLAIAWGRLYFYH